MKESNNIKIIAVDHGYGNIKTANIVTPGRLYGWIVASAGYNSSNHTAGIRCGTGLGFPWRIILLQADLTGRR